MSVMKKVLIADKMSVQAEKIFTANGISFDKKIGLSEEEICNIVNDYEGIIVRSATKITKKIIQSGKRQLPVIPVLTISDTYS